MKITKTRLRQIIKEEVTRAAVDAGILSEEPSDYYKDYRAGSISYAEYKQLVRDFERGGSRPSTVQKSTPPAHTPPEKKWKGSSEDLETRVHRYLIDIGFYHPFNHNPDRVNPFSKGDHPEGGYTSGIPTVIKKAIADGDIDWATWPEIEPTYRKIDRSID